MGAMLGLRKDKQVYGIYYATHTLDNAQVNYVMIEKEFLAMVFVIDKFISYLVGSKVIVFTNHSTIKYFLG